MEENDKTTRIQFDISEKTLAEIERMAELAGASSRAEVIRNALTLYNWYIEQNRAGSKILVGNTDGSLKEFLFLLRGDLRSHLAPEVSTGSLTSTSSVQISLIDPLVYRALKQHPELLRTLDWRTFEKLLADILVHRQSEVEG